MLRVDKMKDIKTFFKLEDNDKMVIAEKYAPKPQPIPNIKHIPRGYFCKAEKLAEVVSKRKYSDIEHDADKVEEEIK